jgi:hypothetical protein
MECYITVIGFSFKQKSVGSLAVLLYSFLYYKIISRFLNSSLVNKSIVFYVLKSENSHRVSEFYFHK